jgi:hypothetical protein
MERDIDFAFKGVSGVDEDLLPTLKDVVSDTYHEKMSDVSHLFH